MQHRVGHTALYLFDFCKVIDMDSPRRRATAKHPHHPGRPLDRSFVFYSDLLMYCTRDLGHD